MITRGEQMLALRRSRMAAAHPFLRGGFRPFFFGGAAWGLIALTLWICTLAGEVSLPTAFDPLSWHRHEMLFGFVGAIVAGISLAIVCSIFFLPVDRRALELSRALRKRMSA